MGVDLCSEIVLFHEQSIERGNAALWVMASETRQAYRAAAEAAKGSKSGRTTHVAHEAKFQAKASEQNCARFGSRVVIGAGERSIPRKHLAAARYDDAQRCSEP
jgi:hypothetical protein